MGKKVKALTDSNQLPLFADSRPAVQSLPVDSSRLDQVFDEDAEVRASFTSKEHYYRSKQWQFKRLQKLRLAGHQCERCGRAGRLEVHHLNYNSLYDEFMQDLRVLCNICHPIADSDREYDSAFHSYVRTKYGGDVSINDFANEADEFDNWWQSKQDDDW